MNINLTYFRLFFGIVVLIFFTILFCFYNVRIAEFTFLKLNERNTSLFLLERGPGKDNYYSHYLKGRIYFVNNQLEKSINSYTKAIELNGDFKENYYGRGLAYGFFDDIYLTQAEGDFIKYIELDNLEFEKTGKHAYGAWAGYNDLAWIYFLKGDFLLQEKVARDGLEISPENPWLLNMLAVSLLAQNQNSNLNMSKRRCIDAKYYLEKSKKLLENISSEQFGEAYSGDKPVFWEIGRSQMLSTIKENLLLCEK